MVAYTFSGKLHKLVEQKSGALQWRVQKPVTFGSSVVHW
jgi:hypothetical protein